MLPVCIIYHKTVSTLLCWVKSTEIFSQESALWALGLFSESTQGLHTVAMYWGDKREQSCALKPNIDHHRHCLG